MVKTVSRPGPSPKSVKKKKSPGQKKPTQKRRLYSPSKVKLALENISNGMNLSTASRTYGIPRATLWNKLNDRAPVDATQPGFISILPLEIENQLEEWLLKMSDRGFPIDQELLLDSVKQIVIENNLPNPFTDNRPGRKWFEGFLRRHKSISKKHAEGLTTTRAKISETVIRRWFEDTKNTLFNDYGKEEIEKLLNNPKKIFNIDETAIFLSPKGSTVLGRKGKSVYNVSKNDEKTCITVALCVNAAGNIAPPCALFSYKRLPGTIAKSAPEPWGVGCTENGWMTGESFFEYIANVFLPYVIKEKIGFPVILFLDGHSSHITIHLHSFCVEHKIILVALPPNATHLMQPLDVSVFRPLKKDWKYTVRHWRIEHNGEEICKENFCKAVHEVIFKGTLQKSIKSGFRATGLYPFEVNNIDFNKLVVNEPESEKEISKDPIPQSHLEYLESKIDQRLLGQFKETMQRGHDWEGDLQASMLYDLWCTVKNDLQPKTIAKDIGNNCLDNKSDNISLSIKDDNSEVIDDDLEHMTMDDLIKEAEVVFAIEDEENNVGLCDVNEGTSSDLSRSSLENKVNLGVNEKTTVEDGAYSSPRPSTSKIIPVKRNIFNELTFWPGPKKGTPKRKNQQQKMPSVITSNAWKQYFEEKEKVKADKEEAKKKKQEERNLKQKSKNNEDWICGRCAESYNKEKRLKISNKWIECDNCKRTFHFSCIPKIHLEAWDIQEKDLDSGAIDFNCHVCINEDDILDDVKVLGND